MSNCCFTAPLPQFMDLCSTAAIPSTHAPLLHCSTAAAAHVQDRKYALPAVGMHFHQLLLRCCHVLWGGLLQVLQQGAMSELCAATALPCPALHLCCIAAPRSVHSIRAAAQVMVHIHLCRMHNYIQIHIHICTYQFIWNMYNNVAALHLCRSVSHGSQSLVSDGALACAWSDIMWAWGNHGY
jgi:hypothetical protein